MKELVEKRQQNSKTFDLGNGKRQLRVSIGPIHYKDNYAEWKDIDEGYSEPDTAPFNRKYSRLPYGLRLSDDSTRRIYPDRKDQSYWLEFGKILPDMGLPEKVEKEVWGWKHGTYDSQVIIDGGQVKLKITLKTPAAPTSFTIPFTTTGLTRDGLTFKHNGEAAGIIRKSIATDAEDNTREVDITFEEEKIILNLDTTGLVYPIRIDPTWQVTAGTDDCFRKLAPDYWLLTCGYIQAGADGASHYQQGGGMRFTNITIPQGATIDEAYLTLCCSYALADTYPLTRISAEDVDDAITFADNAAAFDARWAARTTARVDWDIIADWTLNADYNSPEIKTVIKEIVDRVGWASGQDMVIFWDDFEDRSPHTAEYTRQAYSYEGHSPSAPKLVITHSVPTVPTVTTQDADEITHASAKLHGTITALNNGNCDLRGFDWRQFAAFKISVGSTPHTDYGLGYPVTYKFSIPADAVNLTAWQKKTLPSAWTQLTEKTSNDFFNGIDAVRFDYTNDFAYVSVAFGSDSDDIYILFKDASGDPLAGVAFVEICEYYDNRKAVFTLTADDIGDAWPAVLTLIDEARTRNLWVTPGVWLVSGRWEESYWGELQPRLDLGYLEIANHSYNHQDLPYDDYDLEIGGSKQVIIDNLDLPTIYKKGTTEYIPAWLEPGGASDATVREKLAEYKYLIARRGPPEGDVFATWDATYGLYNRIARSIQMGSDGVESEATLNSKFDSVYATGGIYHIMCHAAAVNWNEGQYALNHFDYIKDKKDVWYVGFGALYMYHYAQERGEVSVSSYEEYTDSWTEGTPESYVYGVGAFEHTISGLVFDTTYKFRAKAHNSDGWGYGEDKEFTTGLAGTLGKTAHMAAKMIAGKLL